MQFSEKVCVQKQRIDSTNTKSKERDDGVCNGLPLNDSHMELRIINYELGALPIVPSDSFSNTAANQRRELLSFVFGIADNNSKVVLLVFLFHRM